MPVNDLDFPTFSERALLEYSALLSRYRLLLFERLTGRLAESMESPGKTELAAAGARYLEQLLDDASLPKAFISTHIDHWATMQMLQQSTDPNVPDIVRTRLLDTLALTVSERETDPAYFAADRTNAHGSAEQDGLRIAFDASLFGVRGVSGCQEDQRAFARQLAEAYATITQIAPEITDWIGAVVPLVCWLGPCGSDGTSRSESYSPGGPIFLSSALTAWDLAENLVHETQHHRFHLWALAEPFASITSSRAEYVSPWRQDVRPLYGLHLGLHAFLMVNILRLRFGLAENPALIDRFAQTHASNLFAFGTIVDFDEPTALGRDYLQGCARVLSEHDTALSNHPSAGMVEAVLGRIGTQCERAEREFGGIRNTGPSLRNRQAAIALTRSLEDIHDENARFSLPR
jgi:hypothetical protein